MTNVIKFCSGIIKRNIWLKGKCLVSTVNQRNDSILNLSKSFYVNSFGHDKRDEKIDCYEIDFVNYIND